MCFAPKTIQHYKNSLLKINQQINYIYNDSKLQNTQYDNIELRRYMIDNHKSGSLNDFMIYQSMINKIPRLQFTQEDNNKFNEFIEKISTNIDEYKKIYGHNICIGINVIIAYLFPYIPNLQSFLLNAKYNKHYFEKLDKLMQIDSNKYRYYIIDKIKTD
jgi:hypothetical protein